MALRTTTASLVFLLFALYAASGRATGAHKGDLGWVPSRSACDGSVGECAAAGGGEFELDSESSRRFLAATRYISYGALKGDAVPCSRRGASYYNCRPGAQANPYSRGCSAITRCRGG